MTYIFEIRICNSCGLRYPITQGHSFGTRCPICLGGTRLVLEKHVGDEARTREVAKAKKGPMKAVLLDNIRSAWNVGSILRSADGFGFDHVYLCGITPTPEQEAVQKTSLGAEEYVTWSYHKDAVKLVQGLKKEGWQVWALEEDDRAISIKKAAKPSKGSQPVVVIAGSETTGVDPDLVKLCDQILFIPMQGQKRSFNVAVAFGIAGYAFV